MGLLNDLHALSVSVATAGRGMMVYDPVARMPEQMLELYEFEGCPFCRKVREAMTSMDLPYVCRSSAKGSAKRDQVVERGGKAMFPFLVDPNTGREMYESEDIITYLKETYGCGRSSWSRGISPVVTASAVLGSALRPRGSRVEALRLEQPEVLLELYTFEASPYCRKVREVLHELDLDFRVLNVGRRSARRPDLVKRGGKMMVPYLIDPNTETEMYESDDIVAYLRRTYA